MKMEDLLKALDDAGYTPETIPTSRSAAIVGNSLTGEQTRALSAVLDKTGIDGIAANFLKLVAAKRRLFAARDMVKAYRALVARHKGEVTAEVTLAQKPSEAHLAAIKDVLTAMTRKEVQMDVKVDPAIIGGLVVKLGSRMVDSSLRTKLNAIKLAMKEAR